MTEVIIKMFGNSARVLVKDGEFNDVNGEYQHHDFSQRITNHGCNNIIGNILHNVGNTCPQVIYHGGTRSMHFGRRSATSTVVTTVGASAIVNHAPSPSQSQVAKGSLPLAQYFCTQPGDIRQMSLREFAFMEHQMEQMGQEMDSERRDDEEQNTIGLEMFNHDDDTSDEEMSITTRSQSLSANFNRLTIEERVSSSSRSRSTLIHASSSSGYQSQHFIIAGNHTETDNSFHLFNFNSNKVENNVIENSFGEGRQENIIQSTRRGSNHWQSHVP